MNIVIAIDSFKGSLSSQEAGNAAAEGIRRVFPDADICVFPVADGGEGTTAALVSAYGGTFRTVTVSDPLGRPISSKYGILPDGTAVIEMAAASGLPLLSPAEYNPLHTTTRGFGEMIADALNMGCTELLLGIGGSATNDGGAGCLQALGFDLIRADGTAVPPGAAGCAEIAEIHTNSADSRLKNCRIRVACDVSNPLCGENGCSAVFAPQKGADTRLCAEMDTYLRHYADVVKTAFPSADPDAPGAGAAGGLGFALKSVFGAEILPGIALIAEKTGLAAAIPAADFVITGEGCMDAQTAMGKAPAGIANIAKQHGKPVIAFCGIAGTGAEQCHSAGIDAVFPILRTVCTKKQAMQPEFAAKNLADTAEEIFRVLHLRV